MLIDGAALEAPAPLLDDLLRAGLEADPDRPALVSAVRSMSWRELEEESERLAGGYRALGLEPGDRIVFLTDGMLERNAVAVDLPAVIAETRALHPREAVRALADCVLDATGGELSDDATVLCLDWHGGHDAAAGD